MTVGGAKKKPARERLRRYRRGRFSEWLAVLLLTAKGYRVLARRVRTPVGEIDIVALRRRRLAFVEVKRRDSFESALLAVTPRQRTRIMRASEVWLRRHPGYRECERTFDLVLLAKNRWPRHLRDVIEAMANPV